MARRVHASESTVDSRSDFGAPYSVTVLCARVSSGWWRCAKLRAVDRPWSKSCSVRRSRCTAELQCHGQPETVLSLV